MNTKKHRVVSIVICILFVFIAFASLFYVVKEEKHHCTGEECSVCACILLAEQTLKNLKTGGIDVSDLSPILVSSALMLICQALHICGTSLVSQKVRMNN